MALKFMPKKPRTGKYKPRIAKRVAKPEARSGKAAALHTSKPSMSDVIGSLATRKRKGTL